MLRANIEENVPHTKGTLSGYSEFGFEILSQKNPVGEVSVCSRKRVVFKYKDGKRRDELRQNCGGWIKENETYFSIVFDYSEFNEAAVSASSTFERDAKSVLSSTRVVPGA